MIQKTLLTAAHAEQVMTHPPRVPQVCGDLVMLGFLGSTGSFEGTVPGAEGGPLGQNWLGLCGYHTTAASPPASTWPPTQGGFIPP